MKIVGPEGIQQVINRYNNFNTFLNVILHCIRALSLITRRMKGKGRRKEAPNGFEITRFYAKISQDMQKVSCIFTLTLSPILSKDKLPSDKMIAIFGPSGAGVEKKYKVHQDNYIFVISLIVGWFKSTSNVLFYLGLKPSVE